MLLLQFDYRNKGKEIIVELLMEVPVSALFFKCFFSDLHCSYYVCKLF